MAFVVYISRALTKGRGPFHSPNKKSHQIALMALNTFFKFWI